MQKVASLPVLMGALGIVALLNGGTAHAQSRVMNPGATAGTTTSGNVTSLQGPGMPPVNAQQNARGTDNRQVFQLLGLSGQIAAPVGPAYNDDVAYRTFGGQPMRGRDAILAQSMDGAP